MESSNILSDYDFGGWATKADMLCSDGRIIGKDAFQKNDGLVVPLVWNHKYNSPDEVLGKALLQNRPEGVYAYGQFNDSEHGQVARLLVQHGDVDRLSIFANGLTHQGCKVVDGNIIEVSLVLAGANPGAVIDSVIAHNDDGYEEGYISSGEYLEDIKGLTHSEDDTKGGQKMADKNKDSNESENTDGETPMDVYNTLTDKQQKAVCAIIGQILEEHGIVPDSDKESKVTEKNNKDEKEASAKHSDEPSKEDDNAEDTIGAIFDTFSEKQKKAAYILVMEALKDAGFTTDNAEPKQSEDNKKGKTDKTKGGNEEMKHNVFDKGTDTLDTLTHSEMTDILTEARKSNSSLANTFLQHGITHIEYMFPEAQMVPDGVGYVKRDDTWVTKVMDGVHKSPFSQVKSVYADLTEADARAKGYVKGAQKTDEVFSLLKRKTSPTTIYKHQSIDRDDMVDITDIDTVALVKTEMRFMLDEEAARAILVGDGRSSSSPDKINEQNIRPIWTDDDVYTVKAAVPVTKDTTDEEKAKAFIKATIKSRKNYKGSGNPTMFMGEDMLTACLLLEDNNGRPMYDTITKLTTALRAAEIVPVPIMDDLKREVSTKTHFLGGIYVNLTDYNVGADKGGAVNMFDDFDIDYNKQKYLLETRFSGAMVKPYGAVAIEFVADTASLS